jgi:hypothetical protein
MLQQDPIKLLVYNMLLDIFEEKSKLKYVEYLYLQLMKKVYVIGKIKKFYETISDHFTRNDINNNEKKQNSEIFK